VVDINNDDIASMKIRKSNLKFYDEKVESDYLKNSASNIIMAFLYYLLILFIFFAVDIVIQGLYGHIQQEIISKSLKFANIIFGFFLLMRNFKTNFLMNFKFFYYLTIAIDIICIYIEKSDNDIKICLECIAIFSYPLFFANKRFVSMLVGGILYILGVLPAVFINDFGIKRFLFINITIQYHRALLIVGSIVIMLTYGYFEELYLRINYLKYHKKLLSLKKDKEIYSNLVPEFVREKMELGERGAAIDYEMSTIIFCDISDFDKLVANMTAIELISLLDRIYNTFDQLCALHGLQKIETVGKTYMAAGGIQECEKDVDPILLSRHHSIRTFELSLDILDTMHKMTLENGEMVKVKIGIHSGKVIASVVGNHKPQFSLIGDAINTTARMCAYSSEMCVLCSEQAYNNICGAYNDFTKSTKEVKGKGLLNIYLHNPFADRRTDTRMKFKSETFVTRTYFRQGTLNRNNLQKQPSNLPKSNTNQRSAFLYESSIDMPMDDTKGNRPRLSKALTKRDDGTQMSDAKNEKHKLFSGSFFFLNFKGLAEAEDLFYKFNTQVFSTSGFKSKVLNFLYIIIISIALFNLAADYQYAGILFLFALCKGVLLVTLLYFINYYDDKIKQNHDFIQRANFLIFLGFTLLIQIHLNFVKEYAIINLIMEQNITTLVVSYNGLLTYRQIFANLIVYIILFGVNIGINYSKAVIVKYLVFAICICIITFIFIIVRYYIATQGYLDNKVESENLRRIEKLLFNLMPPHVVQNLKEDIPVADNLEYVTLLFAGSFSFYNRYRKIY
jgi:class 3 adenylate cyclase